MPAFPMLSHGRAKAPMGYGARLLGWCPRQNQGAVCVACTLCACDWFEAGLARPRRKGERYTTVPTCHIRAVITSLGVNFTRGLVCLLDKLLGARNELLDPTGRDGGGRPHNCHVGFVEFPMST